MIKTKALSLNCLREILIVRIYILLHYNMCILRMLCLKRIIGEVIRFFILKHKTEKYLRINGSDILKKEQKVIKIRVMNILKNRIEN